MKHHASACLLLSVLSVMLAAPAIAQQAGDPYADRVVSFTPGNPASRPWNDPQRVLGPPDFNEANTTGWLTLGVGGSVTVEFVDNVAGDGPGADIEIVGDPGNDEQWTVEVSTDGQAYKSFGLVSERAQLDLAKVGLAEVRFVRITDDGDPSGGASPGAELDAVVALNSRSLAAATPTGAPASAPAKQATAAISSTAADASPLVDREWVRLGGPLGGLGYDIRMRPDNPDVMLVTDSFAGIHGSTDGGQTWFTSNEGITARAGDSGDLIPAFCLTIDPNNPNVVWAGMQYLGQIYRSTDGGRTWQRRDEGIAGGQGLSFRGLTVEPGNSDVVYAAGEISSWVWAGKEIKGFFDLTKGVVYKSTDGGGHWQAIWQGDNLARYVWIDPRDVDTLYVSTGIFDRDAANSDPVSWRQGNPIPGGVGIVKSVDGGATWTPINEGLENLYVGSLFMHPENPDVLLAGAGHWVSYGLGYYEGSGVYLTTDGGAHWELVQRTPDGAPITSVEFALSDPNIAYAGGGNQFYCSEDGGRTWQLLLRPNGRWGPPGANQGIPIDFQVDPRDPLRIFSNNYGGGNFLSEDGGQTWISASTGYSGAEIREVAVDPRNPAIVYAIGNSGPFVSADGGVHWRGLTPENLPALNLGEVIALDPHDPDRVVMAHPDATWIYWSADAGWTWQEAQYQRFTNQADIPLDMGLGGLVAVAFSPTRPGKVYGAYGHNTCSRSGEACDHKVQFSVLTSEDGGRTWQHPTGVPGDGLPASAVVAHPADPDVAWLAIPEEGVYRTADGGATWTPSMKGLESKRVMSLAVDPRNPAVLYAGVVADGVFKSADGGATWKRSSAGMDPNEPILVLAVDPVRTHVIYAGSLRSGVFVSQDGAETWRPLSQGLHNRTVLGLALAADGQTLYAGTDGGGVYRLSTLSQAQFDALAPALASSPAQSAPTPTAASNPPAATAPTAIPSALEGSEASGGSPTPVPTATPPSSKGGGLCGGAAALPLLLVGVVSLVRSRRPYHPGPTGK
jgi:photosystem II stability/assembly factor-like uncharacterized protein